MESPSLKVMRAIEELGGSMYFTDFPWQLYALAALALAGWGFAKLIVYQVRGVPEALLFFGVSFIVSGFALEQMALVDLVGYLKHQDDPLLASVYGFAGLPKWAYEAPFLVGFGVIALAILYRAAIYLSDHWQERKKRRQEPAEDPAVAV